jgi:hypothetical protein
MKSLIKFHFTTVFIHLILTGCIFLTKVFFNLFSMKTLMLPMLVRQIIKLQSPTSIAT